MPNTDYSHRAAVDKLGIKPGHAVMVVPSAGELHAALCDQIHERVGRPLGVDGELLDIVLASVDATTDVQAILQEWSTRIHPAGAIWLITPKRNCPGYVDQRDLIHQGAAARLVDNKVCALSKTRSAMRFVVRRADRPATP